MIDLVRVVFVVATLVASARAKLRAGVVVALVVAVVIVAELASLLALPDGPMPAELAFGAIFLGPTALAPIDPIHHLLVAALGAFAARTAFAKSAPVHPELEDARLLDRAGLRLVGLAVLHALLSLSGFMTRALGH